MPTGIGGIHGAVEINDEVAVVLEVEIHAVIEAAEGFLGGLDMELILVCPVLQIIAENRNGQGKKEDGFEKHVSGMYFGEWMLTAFAIWIEETNRNPTSPKHPLYTRSSQCQAGVTTL